MPLNYAIHESERLVISTGSGVVSYAEIVAHQNRLLADPEFSAEFDQLIDCRQATQIAITPEQAQSIGQRRVFSRSSRRALVASQPVVFGIGRELQAYTESFSDPSRTSVFYDLASALKWLGRENLQVPQ